MKISPDEFAAAAKVRDAGNVSIVRAGGAADLANSSGRIIRYLFSTPDVARDNHTIAHWQLDNFQRNPVFLWAHESKSPPIGKVVDLEDRAGRLSGSVEYADADTYPFADTIFRLVKGGYIHAVSTSWDPIKWKFSTDRSRPGGVDFDLVDLLELSQVPVPALPNALATARAAGIDTGPLYQWAEQVLDSGGMLLVPRAELEALRREAKMPSGSWKSRAEAADKARREASGWKVGASRNLPIEDGLDWPPLSALDAKLRAKASLLWDKNSGNLLGCFANIAADGRLKTCRAALDSAADELAGFDLPEDVRREAEAVIEHYRQRMVTEAHPADVTEPNFKRDLYGISQAAYLLQCASDIAKDCAFEAEYEKDGSPLPAEIAAIAKQLGEWLKKYVSEEVQEELTGGAPADDLVMRAFSRTGKVLSSASERSLRECHDHMTRGCDMLKRFIDDALGDMDDDDEGDGEGYERYNPHHGPDGKFASGGGGGGKTKVTASAVKLSKKIFGSSLTLLGEAAGLNKGASIALGAGELFGPAGIAAGAAVAVFIESGGAKATAKAIAGLFKKELPESVADLLEPKLMKERALSKGDLESFLETATDDEIKAFAKAMLETLSDDEKAELLEVLQATVARVAGEVEDEDDQEEAERAIRARRARALELQLQLN